MHCETLRLSRSIEEVNFTSVRKTNIAQSVLKAKQLQWKSYFIRCVRVTALTVYSACPQPVISLIF